VTYSAEPCVLIGLYDITERKRRYDDIRRHGVPRHADDAAQSRLAFDQSVNHALADVTRTGNKRLAGAVRRSSDQFKQVNRYLLGTRAGDRLAAGDRDQARQHRCARPTAFARLGGDEFVVLLPEIVDFAAVAGVRGSCSSRICEAADDRGARVRG
jgi:predicted signal transduction protein with EAL and GGDEF domain